MAKDCADCGLADCGLEPGTWRFRDLAPPRGPLSWADSGSALKKRTECTPRELRGSVLRPFLGPR
eukprot:1108365-Alexandrium_andersonii.AAC.1